MTDLVGLSPEQINAIAGTDVASESNLIRAAAALGSLRASNARTQAYVEANKPDLVGVTLDGKDYQIRRQDLPQTLEVIRKTNRDKDVEIFNLIGGAKIPIRREDIPAMFQAINSMQRIPFQNRADAALEQLRGAQAEEASARTTRTDVETNAARDRAIAIKALSGIPITDVGSAENFSNLISASSNVAAALTNKFSSKDSLTPSDLNKIQKSMGEIASLKPDDITDTDIMNYNKLSEVTTGTSVMGRDADGEPFTLDLPVKGGEQLTASMIRDAAKRNGLTFNAFINLLKLRLEEESK